MSNITNNIHNIRQQIHALQQTPVTLLAVSKGRSTTEIEQAHRENITHFGENYLQEALPKIATLSSKSITWHFIGRLQRNKCRKIAANFAWVQTVDSLEKAELLNMHRPAHLAALNVCLQINIDKDPQKAGILATDALHLAQQLQTLPQLKLRGLMTMTKNTADSNAIHTAYQQMHQLFQQINANGIAIDTLSMGMSNDYLLAIKAGATLIRVGRQIFQDKD